MQLRGIDFGPCFQTSGLTGFFGEAYWFHNVPGVRNWYNFEGATFVAKSTTWSETRGNMPLSSSTFRPRSLWPDCIKVDWINKRMLNAVGLTGPGADAILYHGFHRGGWPIDRPIMISFFPEGKTTGERLAHAVKFCEALAEYLTRLRRRGVRIQIGLQINLSCPNSEVAPDVLIREATQFLDIAKALGIPLVIKVNLLVPVEALTQIADHPECDAICFSNTIPFGQLPEFIPWDVWYPNGSPLKKFGGGGLSGAPLLEFVAKYLNVARVAGIEIPFIAGGGITEPSDVHYLVRNGLRRGIDAIAIGSIAVLRPWNIQPTIERVHQLLGKTNAVQLAA